jgi:hypothetical protein
MAPSSDVGVVERALTWGAGGAAAGAIGGMLQAGWTSPAAGAPSTAFVSSKVATHSATLAAIAATFATTETMLNQARGHSAANSAMAGCAAGSLFGLRQNNYFMAGFGCALMGAAQGFGERAISAPLASEPNTSATCSTAPCLLHVSASPASPARTSRMGSSLPLRTCTAACRSPLWLV